ncbi:putative nuclease HARBI1 [Mya arenaria]|uniref:putative nuclease HARBI1 n=1 Tax=Mya arenaria TaxID=6604 RepID=UPI0022E96ED9|nr:putative nuclease HARBI1 [Mya arenaria]
MDRAPNLNDLTEMEIIQRYRFDMNGILYLEQLIGNGITPKVNRNNALRARQKILITLRSHKITRALVERSIGQLKKRFGVLHGEINLEPHKVCKVIVACCVLHNICKERAIPINGDDDSDDEDDNADDQLAQGVRQPPNVAGNRFRDHVAATYFRP